MKLLPLLTFCLLLFFCSDAQSISWLHGNWRGETYFPNGPITRRIIVTLHVTNVTGNRFEATLANLYPNDTTVRLERKIAGRIINQSMQIESSEQTYIRDPRTQNFWRDCTGCDIQSDFSINNNKVEIRLKTTNCNDECNGETTFSRDTSELDPLQQKDLAKWLHLPAPKPLAKRSSIASDSSGLSPKVKVTALEKENPQKGQPAMKDTVTKIRVTADKNRSDTATPAPTLTASRNLSLSDSSTLQKAARRTLAEPKSDNIAALSATQKQAAGMPLKKGTSDSIAAAKRKDSTEKLIETFKSDTLPAALTTRTTNLITTYQVNSPHIVVQLFDNAEIDGDIVTVYHNGQLIANRQSLTHKALSITIDASKANAHHEFIMVADNLGLIPPNTALMRVIAGKQKFELEVSSDFNNNSKIAVDYIGE